MIREANKNDCINIAALSIQVWLHTYAIDGIRTEMSKYAICTFTEQYFSNLLSDNKYKILVYEKENHLLGYIIVNLESYFENDINRYEVEKLYVQEHFQGRGIGKKLLEEINIRFGSKYWLSTWVYNKKAIEFYKHLGFEDIGKIYFELEGEKHENRVLQFCNT